MKPLQHARASVKRYGGTLDDYMPIHTFIDLSKSTNADVRHRAIFHNTLGPFVCMAVFGYYIVNKDGKSVSVRQIAEDHIFEDLGFIPDVSKWLELLPVQPWMDKVTAGRANKKRKNIEKEWNNVD